MAGALFADILITCSFCESLGLGQLCTGQAHYLKMEQNSNCSINCVKVDVILLKAALRSVNTNVSLMQFAKRTGS